MAGARRDTVVGESHLGVSGRLHGFAKKNVIEIFVLIDI